MMESMFDLDAGMHAIEHGGDVKVGVCRSCDVEKHLRRTSRWFDLCADAYKRRIIERLLKHFDSKDMRTYLRGILKPLLRKDFLYSKPSNMPVPHSEKVAPEKSATASPEEEKDAKRRADSAGSRKAVSIKEKTEGEDEDGGGEDGEQPQSTKDDASSSMTAEEMAVVATNRFSTRTPYAYRVGGITYDGGMDQLVAKLFKWYETTTPWSKINFVVGLLQDCDVPLLEFTMGLLSRSKKRDLIRSLPVHISKRILSSLDDDTLKSAMRVSKHWLQLVKEVLAERELRKEANIMQEFYARNMKSSKAVSEIEQGDEIQSMWLEERNNFCGRYNLRAFRNQEERGRVTHYDGNTHVISASWNRTIEVWNVATGKCVRIIKGHAGSVRCLRLCEKFDFILSGGFDTTIRQWELSTGACKRILKGHTSTVQCLDHDDELIVSGSRDHNVKIWNFESNQCIQTIHHTSSVLCLMLHKKRLATGTADGKVRIWNLETYNCTRSMLAHTGPVNCIQFDDWHLISGGADHEAKLWSVKTGMCLKVMEHPDEINALQFSHLRVVTGAGDGKVRVWNLRTGHCIRTLRISAASDPIRCLTYADVDRLVISTDAGITAIDFETGRENQAAGAKTDTEAMEAAAANKRWLAAAQAAERERQRKNRDLPEFARDPNAAGPREEGPQRHAHLLQLMSSLRARPLAGVPNLPEGAAPNVTASEPPPIRVETLEVPQPPPTVAALQEAEAAVNAAGITTLDKTKAASAVLLASRKSKSQTITPVQEKGWAVARVGDKTPLPQHPLDLQQRPRSSLGVREGESMEIVDLDPTSLRARARRPASAVAALVQAVSSSDIGRAASRAQSAKSLRSTIAANAAVASQFPPGSTIGPDGVVLAPAGRQVPAALAVTQLRDLTGTMPLPFGKSINDPWPTDVAEAKDGQKRPKSSPTRKASGKGGRARRVKSGHAAVRVPAQGGAVSPSSPKGSPRGSPRSARKQPKPALESESSSEDEGKRSSFPRGSSRTPRPTKATDKRPPRAPASTTITILPVTEYGVTSSALKISLLRVPSDVTDNSEGGLANYGMYANTGVYFRDPNEFLTSL